jgi:hypothetical protein
MPLIQLSNEVSLAVKKQAEKPARSSRSARRKGAAIGTSSLIRRTSALTMLPTAEGAAALAAAAPDSEAPATAQEHAVDEDEHEHASGRCASPATSATRALAAKAFTLGTWAG